MSELNFDKKCQCECIVAQFYTVPRKVEDEQNPSLLDEPIVHTPSSGRHTIKIRLEKKDSSDIVH